MAWKFSGRMDVYAEIASRYEQYITLGILKDGDKLPSVRCLAEECGVNPNTVAKAYELLAEKGLVKGVPKKGLYVTCSNQNDNGGALYDECTSVIRSLKNMGITYCQIIKAVEEIYERGSKADDKN